MVGRRLVRAWALVTLVAVVAGCGGDDEQADSREAPAGSVTTQSSAPQDEDGRGDDVVEEAVADPDDGRFFMFVTTADRRQLVARFDDGGIEPAVVPDVSAFERIWKIDDERVLAGVGPFDIVDAASGQVQAPVPSPTPGPPAFAFCHSIDEPVLDGRFFVASDCPGLDVAATSVLMDLDGTEVARHSSDRIGSPCLRAPGDEVVCQDPGQVTVYPPDGDLGDAAVVSIPSGSNASGLFDGTLYVEDRGSGSLIAFDVDSGEERWRFPFRIGDDGRLSASMRLSECGSFVQVREQNTGTSQETTIVSAASGEPVFEMFGQDSVMCAPEQGVAQHRPAQAPVSAAYSLDEDDPFTYLWDAEGTPEFGRDRFPMFMETASGTVVLDVDGSMSESPEGCVVPVAFVDDEDRYVCATPADTEPPEDGVPSAGFTLELFGPDGDVEARWQIQDLSVDDITRVTVVPSGDAVALGADRADGSALELLDPVTFESRYVTMAPEGLEF